MHNLIIQYILLFTVVLIIMMYADKVKIAYPILLLAAGLILGFYTNLSDIILDPDIIFLLILPPLLYEAAWSTSWKDFWKWRRVISSFAFIIVILTSCAIAFAASHFIPGFTLASGFLLGAIISPPDAVSAGAILQNMKVPKRLVTILQGESLLNDASSLIVFRFALIAITTGKFVMTNAAANFVVVIIMGILTGVLVALVFYAVHRWLPTTVNIDIILTFVTPYVMYTVAEEFHFSGVLAVVSGGLFLSAQRDVILTHKSRYQSVNVWESVSFLLNGFVFILIGLQFPTIITELGADGLPPAIKYSAVICGLLIASRFVSIFGAVLFSMFISKFIKTNDANPGWKIPLIFGWAGMRGVVSLAAALSIPLTLQSGMPFPQRNLILFITFSVILVTLVLQGLTLPALIKWLNVPDPDYTLSDEKQKQLIEIELSALALDILENKYSRELNQNAMLASVKVKLDIEMELFNNSNQHDSQEKLDSIYKDYRMILEDILQKQRLRLKMLNKEESFSHDLIRERLDMLDMEEERIDHYFSSRA